MDKWVTSPQIIVSSEADCWLYAQGDCACAEPVLGQYAARVALPVEWEQRAWRVPRRLYRDHLSPQHVLAGDVARGGSVAVLNLPAVRLLDQFAQPIAPQHVLAGLIEMEGQEAQLSIRQMCSLGLLAQVGGVPRRGMTQAQTLTAWLQITDACNLRCSYCYLDRNVSAMSLETGKRAMDAVFRSAWWHNYSCVKIKYTGGEPTLNLSLIFQLHDYAERLAGQSNLALDEVVLSNGTLLTAQTIEQLRTKHIRLMISLDGVGRYHDAQRKFASGQGSFSQVACNIDLALQHGLIPDISITISDRNLEGLPETVKCILDRDLPFSLNFYRENDCSASFKDLRFSDQRIIEAMKRTYKVIEENLPRRSLLGSLVDRASFIAPHVHTCSVGRDYMVIDQLGRIAKCQMEITKTVTDIAANNPLQLVRDDQLGIQNPSVDEKENCRECEWRYWCAGGCPLATYRATGRYDVKSPNCGIYRALYPEALRLEGLRLIKHAEVFDHEICA